LNKGGDRHNFLVSARLSFKDKKNSHKPSRTPSTDSTQSGEENAKTPTIHQKTRVQSGTGAMMTPGGHISSSDTRAIPLIGKQAEHSSAYVLYEE
jgi:hypothetical protein